MKEIVQGQKEMPEIRREMARIRKLGGHIFTNYYNQCDHYAEPLTFWGGKESCAFVWPDNGIQRVYFYAHDKEELVGILAQAEPGSSIDFITKEKEDGADLFAKAGYYRRFEYGRFVLGAKSETAKQMNQTLSEDKTIYQELYQAYQARPAVVEEAEEIDACLREKFDAYEAHFYDMDTLRAYIRKKWVWIVKQDGKIIAADMFEIQGRKCYGAFLFNNGPVAVLTSLISATDAYVVGLGCIQSYCWMNLANKRILRYNLTYGGYKFDGMYDMIYVKS